MDFYQKRYLGEEVEKSIKIYDYIPEFILTRKPPFKTHFLSPTIVIILPKNKSLLYEKGLCRFNKNKNSVRFGNLPKEFDESITEILRHYNKGNFFDYATKETKDLPITKQVACFYYDKKRYLFPLKYNGDDLQKQKVVSEILTTIYKIFDELTLLITKKADEYYHNLDFERMFDRYLKAKEKFQEKENKKFDKINYFDFW